MADRRRTWQEIRDLVEAGECHRLGRLASELAAYRAALARIRKDYETVEDYILVSKRPPG